MSNQKTIQAYMDRVLSGKQLAGELEILSVKRHLHDLDTAYDRGMYFDSKAGLRVIQFFSFLRHGKGKDFAGKPFVLSDWQAFKFYVQYGWKGPGNIRRFRKAYLEIAKKNGKTAMLGGEALYHLLADNEIGAEVYSAATKRDQASICFNDTKQIVKYSPQIKNKLKMFQYSIAYEEQGNFFKALSSDSTTQDGLNTHFGIIDEYHAWKSNDLFDNIESSMASRSEPMMDIITTAGFNKTTPCFVLRDVCIKILKGIIEQDDLFPMIFSLDEEDDWEDPRMWVKSNPNLGISVKEDFIKKKFIDAKNNPSRMNEFKTKQLNMWVDAVKVWIPDDAWMNCAGDILNLTGESCTGGLDLSSTRDLTALSLCFQLPDGTDAYLWFFWMPEDNIADRVKNDRVPYDLWISQGFIRTTPGNVTDYDFIEADILQLKAKYDIEAIAFDRWNSSQLVINLMSEGVNMVPFGQGYGSMSAPTKEFERTIFTRKMNHMGNPVMRWMISNVEIQRDPAGNIKIDKAKASEKVDGPVAAVMAKGQSMTPNDNIDINKIYGERGIRTL
jgi:phage terminase large subunit-like protein